jgi:hypothetical protein
MQQKQHAVISVWPRVHVNMFRHWTTAPDMSPRYHCHMDVLCACGMNMKLYGTGDHWGWTTRTGFWEYNRPKLHHQMCYEVWLDYKSDCHYLRDERRLI